MVKKKIAGFIEKLKKLWEQIKSLLEEIFILTQEKLSPVFEEFFCEPFSGEVYVTRSPPFPQLKKEVETC